MRKRNLVGMLLVAGTMAFAQIRCVATIPPPPPQDPVVVVPARPHPHAVWVGGHYRWDRRHHRHEWVAGHWQIKRGHRWVVIY